MKIALVHDFLKEFGGAERVFLDLCKIFPEAPIYTLYYDKKKMGKYFAGRKITVSSLQKRYQIFRGSDFLLRPFSGKAVEEFDLRGFEVVISNTNSFAKGVITDPDCIHISYCHSPTRYLWDYTHEYEKEHRAKGLKGFILRSIFSKMRVWDFYASKRPDYFLANSQNVAKRIKKYYRRSSIVLYPGVKLSDFEIASRQKKYFLVVSRLSRYKKTELVVEAFKRLPDKLMIAGIGPELQALKKQASGHKNIKFLGFVSDEKLHQLYSGCRALIFPQEEDFGLTPLEAMASGRPVIAYGKGGALETVKEDISGIFFYKQTASEIVSAVEKYKKMRKEFDPHEIRHSVIRFDEGEFERKLKEFINDKVTSNL